MTYQPSIRQCTQNRGHYNSTALKHFMISVHIKMYMLLLFISRAEFIIAIVPAVLVSLIPFPLEDYGPAGFWWYVYTI